MTVDDARPRGQCRDRQRGAAAADEAAGRVVAEVASADVAARTDFVRTPWTGLGGERSAGPPPRKRPRDARGGHCLSGRGRAADGGRADSGRGCRCGRPARARGVRVPSLQAKPRDTRGRGQRTRSRDGRGGRCFRQRYRADVVVRCRCGRGRGGGRRRLPPRKRLQDARKGRCLRRCGPARGGEGESGRSHRGRGHGTAAKVVASAAADVQDGRGGRRRGCATAFRSARTPPGTSAGKDCRGDRESAGTSLPQMRQWGRRWGEMPSVVAPARRPRRMSRGRPRACLCGRAAGRGSSHGRALGISAPRGRPWGDVSARMSGEGAATERHGTAAGIIAPRRRPCGYVAANERRGRAAEACRGTAAEISTPRGRRHVNGGRSDGP